MNQQHPDLTEFLGPSHEHNHEAPLFAETFLRAEGTNISETFLSDNNQGSTPTLTEAILEPDNFLVRTFLCALQTKGEYLLEISLMYVNKMIYLSVYWKGS